MVLEVAGNACQHYLMQGVHLSFKANSPGGLLGLPDPIAHNNFH